MSSNEGNKLGDKEKNRRKEDSYGSKGQLGKRLKSCHNWRERKTYLSFSLSRECCAIIVFAYSPKAVLMLESIVT